MPPAGCCSGLASSRHRTSCALAGLPSGSSRPPAATSALQGLQAAGAQGERRGPCERSSAWLRLNRPHSPAAGLQGETLALGILTPCQPQAGRPTSALQTSLPRRTSRAPSPLRARQPSPSQRCAVAALHCCQCAAAGVAVVHPQGHAMWYRRPALRVRTRSGEESHAARAASRAFCCLPACLPVGGPRFRGGGRRVQDAPAV